MRYFFILIVLLIGCSSESNQSTPVLNSRESPLELRFSTSAGVQPDVAIRQLDFGVTEYTLSASTVGHFEVSLPLQPDERIYGLTERLRDSAPVREPGPLVEDLYPVEFGGINRRGERIEMYVRPTIALYTPFYHSSAGYGLWVDTTLPGSFDIGVSNSSTLSFRFETPSGEEASSLRFYIFPGPTPKEIMRQYHQQTGFPVRFPDWAFLHWRWRDTLTKGPVAELDGFTTNAEIAEDILQYEAHGIPSGVYLFDRPYLLGSNDPDSGGYGSFTWDEERIPNIGQTLDALQRRNFRLGVWIASWALGENGREAAQLGYQAPGSSRVIDFTNPDAARWWQGKLQSFFSTYNIEAVKLDRGEEFTPSRSSDIWADGRRGNEIHNLFPVLQAEVTSDALHAASNSRAVIARAGFAGSQRFVGSWGGDTPGQSDLGLRMAIIKLQRSAFMGFPTWGSDTGGYFPFENREVFARWLQFSALCPIMEIGTWAPWNMPTSPRSDEEMIAIYRRYIILHHDLNPYFSQLADRATAEGTPQARPMIMEFPEDRRFLDTWEQFMLGSEYLVAPVWRVGARTKRVLIPEGRWEWFWDRSLVFEGPTEVIVDAPLDTLPLFQRAR